MVHVVDFEQLAHGIAVDEAGLARRRRTFPMDGMQADIRFQMIPDQLLEAVGTTQAGDDIDRVAKGGEMVGRGEDAAGETLLLAEPARR